MTRHATVKTLPEDGPVPCPRRRCGGTVVEQDTALRWNTIEMQDGVPQVSTNGDYEFEHSGFICDTCLGPVDVTADFEPDYG